MERYLDQVEALGYTFCSLIAEAFGLGPDGLSQFFDAPELMQHRAKIVQYPVVEGTSDQGVGPHYDAGFLTFVSLSCVTGIFIPFLFMRNGCLRCCSCCRRQRTAVCRYKISPAIGSTHRLCLAHLS